MNLGDFSRNSLFGPSGGGGVPEAVGFDQEIQNRCHRNPGKGPTEGPLSPRVNAPPSPNQPPPPGRRSCSGVARNRCWNLRPATAHQRRTRIHCGTLIFFEMENKIMTILPMPETKKIPRVLNVSCVPPHASFFCLTTGRRRRPIRTRDAGEGGGRGPVQTEAGPRLRPFQPGGCRAHQRGGK